MTVADLIRDLAERLATGEIQPEDRVVREWEVAGGEMAYKEVMFADPMILPKWPDNAPSITGGLDHPLYHPDANGPKTRLVKLD